MRRNDREITDRQEILKIMRKCDVCRLALNDDGFPYPVSKFIGDGIVIDLTEKKAGEEIKPVDLKPSLEQIQTGDFVILKTGWYKRFGTETYLDHPYVSANAAELLVNKGVSIVAVDFMNVDPTLWEQWDAHPVFLGNDVLIVENINNSLELEAGRRYQFFFAPIRLQDSDGGPIRALAIQEEWETKI